MKKKVFILFLILFFSVFIPVYAEEYETFQLIPIQTSATVHTDKFDYQNFSFSSSLDDKEYGTITFESIQNNTMSRSAVSINILLFGEDQKNIGFLTYCSDKDVSSEYAGFKLNGNQSSVFSIPVSSKYIISSKTVQDISYIAVMDENIYCRVGGYDKYAGLTIDEVLHYGEATPSKMSQVLEFLRDSRMQKLIFMIAMAVVGCVLLGVVLNFLHLRMYGKSTFLAFLPILHSYVAMKMAFGHIVSLLYIIIAIASLAFYYVFGNYYLLIICSVISGISCFIDIFKMITKKYSLFYFEPSMKLSNVEDSLQDSSFAPIDLSYGDSIVSDEFVEEIQDVSTPLESIGEDVEEDEESSDDDFSDDFYDDNSNDEEESDLSKLFK